MSRKIIVSDLHIDTWTDRKIGKPAKTKQEHFFDLLDWCEDKGIAELVIDGDLMNMPPYKGQCAFPDGPCIARDVIERLVSFATKVPVTYIFGNHDIGISGFRSMGENSISMLRNANFCYPDYRLDCRQDGTLRSTILIEHGHFYDPAILLYLKDLAFQTYVSSNFEAFQWVMQRRDVRDGSPTGVLGAQRPVKVKVGENAYEAIPQSLKLDRVTKPDLKEALGKPEVMKELKDIFSELGKPFIKANWRKAAVHEMRQHVAKSIKAGEPVAPEIYLIFGHTHRIDKKEDINLGNGITGMYLNAGSWAVELDQGPYLDVREDGKVWLQDWINETPKMKWLNK